MPVVSSDSYSALERMLSTLAHLCSLLNLFVPVLGATFAILEIQVQGRDSAFVKAHAREALAFQVFYFVILVALAAVFVGQIYCVPLAPLLILFGLYCNMAGAVSAWRGRQYRYPLTSLLVELWNDGGATVR